MTFKIPDGHYLVSYDYGMGGLWWFIKAASAEEVRAASSDLIVCDEIPDWMLVDEHWKTIGTEDLRNPNDEALRMILAGEA